MESQKLQVPASGITESDHIYKSSNPDSLGFSEISVFVLQLDLENHFGSTIDDETFEAFMTVGDIVDYFEELLNSWTTLRLSKATGNCQWYFF